MVGILIRMNLAMQRNSPKGMRTFWAAAGVILAAGTLALSLATVDDPAISVDLLAGAFAAWTLVLALAPVFGSGGGIRPEHFALLPLPPRRLAVGLLGAALVGIGPAVALFAFAALAVHGFKLGAVPGLIGLVAMLPQLIFVVLLSRLVYEVMGAAMQTRLGMELVALQYSLFLALISVGWFVIQPIVSQTNQVMAEGWPPLLSTFFRVLPSGWGLVAVDAAGRADWGLMLGVLLALVVLIGLMLQVWSTLLARGMSSGPASFTPRRGSPSINIARRLSLPRTRVGAVISKELYTWMRDPWRALELRIAVWTGLFIGAIPLLIGWVDILPFVGLIIVLMGAMVSGNLYGLDGSALWQTLLTPGAELSDVRGRQWAWLLVFAPISIAATAIFTVISGHHWAWPLVLSLLFATLGASVGLVPLFSVEFASPGIDPHKRRNPMDSSGNRVFDAFLMPALVAVMAAPTIAVVVAGLRGNDAVLQWAGVLVGIGSGVLFAWGLGSIASWRLEAKGPELLGLLLRGATSRAKSEESGGWERALKELPLGERIVVWFCMSMFWLPLFPQGLVPLVFKLAGSDVKSWFLALYLPPEYQWPVIFAMIALGMAMLATAIQLPRRRIREQQE